MKVNHKLPTKVRLTATSYTGYETNFKGIFAGATDFVHLREILHQERRLRWRVLLSGDKTGAHMETSLGYKSNPTTNKANMKLNLTSRSNGK